MMQETAILVKATSVSLACASVKFKQPVGEMHVVHISEMESKLPSVACTIRSFICSKGLLCKHSVQGKYGIQMFLFF